VPCARFLLLLSMNNLQHLNSKISVFLSYFIKESYPDYIFSVVDTSLTSDLSHCKVFISVLNDDIKLINLLNKNKNRIKFEMSKKINMRKTPNLIFILDTSETNYQNISDLLNHN